MGRARYHGGMEIRHITPDQYLRQPWKNGGGTTTELLKEVIDGEVLWRLSIAAVEQSGPFSDFPDIDRTIMLLKGNGMVLSFDGVAGQPAEQRIDTLYVPFEFAGEWKTDCRLIDGPVEDFNLMVDRRRAQGKLQVCELSDVTETQELRTDTGALHCLRGRAEITAGKHIVALHVGETLRIDQSAGGSTSLAMRALVSPCSLAVIHIERRILR